MCDKMIKVLYLVCACCSAVTLGGQIGRVMTVSRVHTRGPTAFRPGVSMSRPWAPQSTRLMQSASHRSPYVLYRSPGHRYIRPYMSSGTRGFVNGPWRTTAKLPSIGSPATPEYEFVRAASASPPIVLQTDGGTGAIHTIPAPNLSLSEKPIVVMENIDDIMQAHSGFKTNSVKPMYQVTDKIPDAHRFQNVQIGKNVIEAPNLLGMSKATSLTSPELTALMKNGAALQLAADYGLPAIAMPQGSMLPQQFTVQGFNTIMQEPLNTNSDLLTQNLMFQPDQLFLQKLQNQLYQRFPGVEFVPYQVEPEQQPQVYVVETENNQQKAAIDHKNVIRETQESSVVTLVPQTLIDNKVTENQIPVEVQSITEPQNVTLEIVTSESQPSSTTVQYIVETTTEDQKSTPIYYAQVGQSVGSAVASGFYSAINDVRAAAAVAQVENPQHEVTIENITTTTINPDLKAYFIKGPSSDVSNQTAAELKPVHGVPFAKVEPVNVAYTLLRADDTKQKVTNDGTVYAGQIVEATISEDQDFNNEKANLRRHPPLRLFSVTEKKEATSAPPKLTVVKAKIPPKSKLTFDDKTGEPVLRIYASYVDSPLQKEIITSKLANIKHVKEVIARKQDNHHDNWKSTIRNLDKLQTGSELNQVTEFGLKLRPRMDTDYTSIFEDYK